MRAWLALLAVLLVPCAAGAPAVLSLEKAGDVWNGESIVEVGAADAPRQVPVFVPREARVQAVLAHLPTGPVPVPWSAAGADALLVQLPPEATAASVRFDVPERRPTLVRYVAPEGVTSLDLFVAPPEGLVPQSPQVAFAPAERVAGYHAEAEALSAGETVAVRVVEAGRVGEIPLMLTIGGLSLAVLAGTLAWHRARPPLGGREPQRFVDHLAELQARLLPPAVLFAAANLFYFTSGLRSVEVKGVPLVAPTWGVDGSVAARAFDAVAERLVPPDVTLVVLRPADAVLAQVGMSLFLSLVTVLPLLAYELAAFIGPGLEARERRAAAQSLPLVTGLFLGGALLGYLVMAPLMVRTLYAYAPGIGATPLLAVSELVSFALLVILALALAFELPVVMYVLARLGVARASTFGRYVRHAILVIVVAAGLVTPDPSVVSQLLLAVPIVGLYLLGIAAALLGERSASRGVRDQAAAR